ncbi:MAG: Si-specific NAD(P)(+) transhydrogenase [Deltaproteobacteria bacterium]|nr:Si-specific NAD(P)(+) transhydrogenase [Deltaproteobacteria bacterium]
MTDRYDLVVIGSGPAGQKAAIQGAKAGCRVAIVERGAAVGGECVQRGTIPSKTLRETAVALASFRQRSGNVLDLQMPEGTKISSLLTRLDEVVQSHQRYIGDQLRRNGIDLIHGRARFVSPVEVEVQSVQGARRRLAAGTIVIAVGSTPRVPPNVPIDHEHVLDSDSILSLQYLPRSLTVIGAGVIASEYASIFATLGVQVTMVDKAPRPLGFLDPELTDRFVAEFERSGARYVANAAIASVAADGISVVTTLESGEVLTSDKLLCALGRVASVDGLNLTAAGLAANTRGLIEVDAHLRTVVPHIYAVGDVIGPPALATSAMEQGRRAVCHAMGLPAGLSGETMPVGVYTIPEMACVGLDEAAARERHGEILVGRAAFREIARGHISNARDGFLKMVAAADGSRVLGVQIIGEGATELVHLGQLAMIGAQPVEVFIENIFNFPTLAEAYRVAALDLLSRRADAGLRLRHAAAPVEERDGARVP